MAEGRENSDWSWVVWLVILAAAGYWLLSDRGSKAPPPTIQVEAGAAPTENISPMAPPQANPAPPAVEKPNYDFVDHGVYGYIAGISEEERKKGKAAGDVLRFRYAGTWNGKLHLEQLNASGDMISVSECSRPCVAIKTYANSVVSEVAYNPESVIGAAFEDALKGRLKARPNVRPASTAPAPEESPEARSNVPAGVEENGSD